MKPVIITRALGTADASGVCASQTPGAAGNLTINGTFAAAGVATLDAQRVVGVTSAGNVSATTFTITGTNEEGLTITETITGPNISTTSTTLNFKTVTTVAISGAAAAAVTVGTTGVGSSRWVPLDQHGPTFGVGLFLEFTGAAANVTVQYTGSDVFSTSALTAGFIQATDHPSLTGKAANADSNIAYPPGAVRVKTNSGTGTVKFIVRQAALP